MAYEDGKDYYEEAETSPVAQIAVRDAGRFVEAMLRFFAGTGTLYVSSYDFGYWADRLSCFRTGERVKLKTSLPDPAFLENGFNITEEFIYVFLIDCLKNIDARSMFNQFLVYREGCPLLQCCSNFDDVYINVKAPQSLIRTLTGNNIIASWDTLARAR